MGVLDGLEPQRVFHYFEEISRIPHGSGNVKQISDYLKKFAADRGLECIQDELFNIIIIKEATTGYEQEEPYILQGHMDMVVVSAPDCDIDMTKDPLRLCVENGRIHAQGTSLGGDDGIAVAYALALLEADNISHPRLEVILTVDEETGMEGAKGIDLSMLRGKRLINLDQEEEGVVITSCAGGARVDVSIPLQEDKAEEAAQQSATGQDRQLLQVKITGLLGGHSGIEINKGRGNANCLLGRILKGMSERFTIGLVTMHGGLADNAIPREAEATISVDITCSEAAIAYAQEEAGRIKQELGDKDPAFAVSCNAVNQQEILGGKEGSEAGREMKPHDAASTMQALTCLCNLPNGVIAMSRDLEGLVQTSLNLGVATLEQGALKLSYAVRSSVDEDREALCRQMQEIARETGAVAEVRNTYTGWAYRTESPLRDIIVGIYVEMYGKKPVLEAIHAGVECGILASKIPNLDCVSIGPDMADVHTAQESLDIASVQRMWEYLQAVLAHKC
ncbi:MAG: aminoacyl-histidine dipeptidase [Lachnospiraceae bacterium]|nr:aminoacyl-histidine dipeptidase [Lachnospiraceae bacterium]